MFYRTLKICLETKKLHPEGLSSGRCAACWRVRQRLWRKTPKGKACLKRHDDKIKKTNLYSAKMEVYKAVRKGILKRVSELICVDCGEKASCYDHRDYLKPLKVVPVCTKCNLKRGPGDNL